MEPQPTTHPRARARPARTVALPVAVWGLHMLLPLVGLWLLLARPGFDIRWEHHVSHFWLVVGVAVVNLALGAQMSEAARRRQDLRLFLVSLAFASSAGFLLLHALATPGVLVSGPNAGFVIASPVGLLLAAGFAAGSGIAFSPDASRAVMRHQGLLRGGLLLLLAWAAISIAELPPLDRPLTEEASHLSLRALAVAGVALYALAAARYFQLYRRRPAVVLLSVLTAFTLLAEALVAVALARSWHASWWEWHLLMAFGFGFVAYSAYVQYRREGGTTGLFHGIYLDETVRRVQAEYQAALEAFVAALRQRAGADGPGGAAQAVTASLGRRFDLTEGQVQVLEQAAEAVGAERDQNQRLGALVAIGREARVILDDRELLRRAVALTRTSLGGDRLRVGLLQGGALTFPDDLGGPAPAGEPLQAAIRQALASLQTVELPDGAGGATLLLPLGVKGHPAGLLEVRRARGPFAERDRRLLESLASQLEIAVENARLYRELHGLFHQYMSPDVATALLADPSQAALGGTVAEVTVLFADLRGFTPYAERSPPDRVVALLNCYYGAAVPVVLEQGGTVVQFVGDAIMVLFNAPVRQPDHALRAARAALGMQQAVEAIAAGDPDLPRFRVGVNTGPAVVGNIGSAEVRGFTAIGDTVNLAARLEAVARVGQVVLGEGTYRLIREVAIVTPLGSLNVKGKARPVDAYELHGLS
jgi:class 3 adenylate cyclase